MSRKVEIVKNTYLEYTVLLDTDKQSKFKLDITDERKISIMGRGEKTWLWIGGRSECFSIFIGANSLREFANEILKRLENKDV